MYARIETIEEENLDWRKHLAPHSEKIEDETQETRHIIHPNAKENKIVFNNIVNIFRSLNIKKSITNFFKEYAELSLMVGSIILPYIVGFVISYFLFYYYGGMTISNFVSMQGHLYMGFWSIGAYLFTTAGVIWAVLALF